MGWFSTTFLFLWKVLFFLDLIDRFDEVRPDFILEIFNQRLVFNELLIICCCFYLFTFSFFSFVLFGMVLYNTIIINKQTTIFQKSSPHSNILWHLEIFTLLKYNKKGTIKSILSSKFHCFPPKFCLPFKFSFNGLNTF